MDTMCQNTLKLYKEIDEHIDHHYKSTKLSTYRFSNYLSRTFLANKQAPCGKGCASCCSQFFEISPVEFKVIQNYLMDIDSCLLAIFRENANILMSLFKEYHSDFFESYFTGLQAESEFQTYYKHPERFKIHLPCVFLSQEGACQIYPVRPLTCRTTGVGFKRRFEWGPICNEIRFGFLAHLWQADLRTFIPEINIITSKKIDGFNTRQYPMFYFMSQIGTGKKAID